jgi:RHH-type transcriptional regulator, proline utilization regulon repressor / proline dehydrogenase / delta 1-pyrroline-5-carboxylate dehydrogenase
MAAQRFTTLAVLRDEGKKAVTDGDAEVSEAIDFAHYYAAHGSVPAEVNATPAGITVIAPPWNFPYAIPCGGVLAALMAGNAVILKPAPEVPQCAWLLAQQLWQAGVPRDVLQFYPCTDGDTGRALICHPDVACVVLTGAWETARLFQSWRPSLRLLAETSGKNSLLITAQADRELAIKDLVRSAFGHSGQKCSAASLAIIEAEVYDDPCFRRQLREAAASLPVGPATDPRSVVTPLIREPGENLRRALTTLEPGESWLLEPRVSPDDPCQWSPGIRMGVQPGSWFHQHECFGPVLGLMRAESLEQAIAWQNDTPYGLTAGIHTLDPREISTWRDRAEAGNLYINRPITGAIVQRQPFGGWKRSCIGPGAKAGGPNYVWSFLHLTDAAPADAETSYREAWRTHFSAEHDPSALRCESNDFRYRPARGVVLRLENADAETLRRARLASDLTGTPLTVSLASEESDTAFAARLPRLARHAKFLRTTGTCADAVLHAAHEAGLNHIAAPLTASGRVELRHWLREQSISRTLHRYGQMPELTV